MSADKRRFDRHPIDAPARMTLIGSRGRRKKIDSYIGDLSAVGGFFPDAISLPVGQRVEVDILLPFERPNLPPGEYELIIMTVTGHAIRSGPSGTAVAFTEDYRLVSRNTCTGAKQKARRDLKKKRVDDIHADGRHAQNRHRGAKGQAEVDKKTDR
jgi:hypothetical protein